MNINQLCSVLIREDEGDLAYVLWVQPKAVQKRHIEIFEADAEQLARGIDAAISQLVRRLREEARNLETRAAVDRYCVAMLS